MSKRTTISEVVLAVRHLNSAMGFPDDAGSAIGSKSVPGSFVLQGAYGGWQLQRIGLHGGVESVTTGYRSKKEILDLIHAVRYGVLEGSLRATGITV
jgi:hypothetical protein